MRPRELLLLGLCAVAWSVGRGYCGETIRQESFTTAALDDWKIREGGWKSAAGQAVADGGYSILLNKQKQSPDFQMTADVGFACKDAGAAAGLVFRFREEDATGYVACLRDVEKGVDARFGPWERPVLQLWRLDGAGGWKLLQESKVENCWGDSLRTLKVICHGPDLAVFYQDMANPVIRQFDAQYVRGGFVGLWKDQPGTASYSNFSLGPTDQLPPPAMRADWSAVRGAVYIRSNAVNSVQMWEDYWPNTQIVDRELSYASDYGFNMVQVYLHWIVWDRHREEYLKRIDDFLARAAKYHLKVNFILWDDCGNVEPSLTFADPVPGRHNSQMMPNPSHAIRDSETEMTAHQQRFHEYVSGIVGHLKDDPRISFWQLYNECMGPKEQYRQGSADANLNRLLTWTRDWVKETGTKIPVTATGGGFYGPKYSDFYTYHSYRFGKVPLPNADGGPEHLCTETLDRPDTTLIDCLEQLAGKNNGFVVWDLMIGRDNCRFPWGHPDGSDEPAVPFHGVIYPDGHPWDVHEIQALLGDAAFAALSQKVFTVEYFDGDFKSSKKSSITPRIDFELPDEPGAGSPDASAAISRDAFSVRWTGNLLPPATATYTLYADSDGSLRVWLDGNLVIDKNRSAQATVELTAGSEHATRVEYVHDGGKANAHLFWSSPELEKRSLLLNER